MQKRIITRLKTLQHNPRAHRVKKLTSGDNLYYIREGTFREASFCLRE